MATVIAPNEDPNEELAKAVTPAISSFLIENLLVWLPKKQITHHYTQYKHELGIINDISISYY
ncbi:hypothetical protein PL9214290310 [Planktothrix tepida PCC 9214]|uniref:Uncharacterized protein n=1 Tax=Planktothrix tepida PCC 9214 TaxID=671072 RepID=A0A1J1LDN0_9CYAN|nr:hypothetical protein PL9214290310 [Planktothrix tepida PCC 9214]